ncbi:MAG: glycosyltransferase family 4 protein [Balneolales bacterium]
MLLTYLILFTALLFAELGYFKLANHFNIIDKPNERSSHSRITLRGGGVIFYFGVAAFFVYSGFQYPWFFAGLSMITAVSFIDDVTGVRNLHRIGVHLLSVALMFAGLNLYPEPWWLIALAAIVTIGTINAYNFMDGINGITGGYSLVVLAALSWVNHYEVAFAPGELIGFAMVSLLVFNIFNFRRDARCFAGDVGSVSMAFIIIFLLGSLLVASQNLVYILFLGVYGVDSVLTIAHRLLKKENIFEAHRSHLYQLMANEAGVPHVKVSLAYMAVQAAVCIFIIAIAGQGMLLQHSAALVVLMGLAGVYVWGKRKVMVEKSLGVEVV